MSHKMATLMIGVSAAAAMAALMQVPARAQANYALPTRHIPAAVASGRATFIRAMSPSHVLGISIILPVRNPPALRQFLREVNDPSSPNYRRVLTPQQSAEQFSPTAQQYQAVAEFLESKGIVVTRTWPNRLLIDARATAAQIQGAFHTPIGLYELAARGTFFAPEREPTVSVNLPIWHVGGLSNYAIPRPAILQAQSGPAPTLTGSGPNGYYIGSDLRAA